LHFILRAVMAKTCLSDCCVNAVFSLCGWILFPEKENKHVYERHHKTWRVCYKLHGFVHFIVSTFRNSNLLYKVVLNSKYDTSTQLGIVHAEQTDTTVL